MSAPNQYGVRDPIASVRLDMSSLPTSKQTSLLGGLRAWYHASALRLLLDEIRNLRVHMATSLEMREAEHQGYRDSDPRWSALTLVRRPRRLACSRYMQQLQNRYPRLTSLDWIVAEQSWLAGSE